MGCKKLTYQYAGEDTLEKKLFFEKGGLKKRYAEVKKRIDYYPFGSQMVGRMLSSNQYKYGFNGKEKDDELKGSGNSYDFGARIYDSRLGRWLAMDLLERDYPSVCPYNFSLNTQIGAIDPNGEVVVFINSNHFGDGGKLEY